MSYLTSASSNYYPIYHPSIFQNDPETQKRVIESNAYAYSQMATAKSSSSYTTLYSPSISTSGGTMTHSYFGTHSSSCIG